MALTNKMSASLLKQLSEHSLAKAIATPPAFAKEIRKRSGRINCRSRLSAGAESDLTIMQIEEAMKIVAESSRRTVDSMMKMFTKSLFSQPAPEPWMSEARTTYQELQNESVVDELHSLKVDMARDLS